MSLSKPTHAGNRVVAVFLLALLVRLAPLNRYVTPDEPIWVLRSIAFADAVAAHDGDAIPQTGHPGLTTMALGSLGVRLMQVIRPDEAAVHLAWLRNLAWLPPENSDAFVHLAFFLPACRAVVVTVTSLGLAAVYALARKRLGERAARLLAVFLALDPFFAGLSGLLHTDALQATCILLAALWLCPPQVSHDETAPGVPALLLAALCLALAGLTKTLGLLPAPGIALAALLLWRGPWWRRVLSVAGLAVVTALLISTLYPTFWHDPAAALQTLTGAVAYHEGIGRRGTFFFGKLLDDPGPWFYPLVLLFRLTPPLLLGLWPALRRPENRSVTFWFALPALVYLVGLTLATKKFDRYVLTAIPLLAAATAFAWARRERGSRAFRLWIAVALLGSWALVAPLPLYYADPLIGGPWLARRIIPLGWGEASGLAAAQANRRLDAPETRTLLAENLPGATPFFAGLTRAWDDSLISCADARVAGSDAAAQALPGEHANETLRLAGLPLTTLHTYRAGYPEGALLLPGPLPGASAEAVAPVSDPTALRAWVEQHFPAQTPFIWVHAGVCYPLTERQIEDLLRSPAVTCSDAAPVAGFSTERCTIQAPLSPATPYLARFDGTLDLLAATWPTATHAPGDMTVSLRWQSQGAATAHDIHLALWDGAGNILWSKGGHELLDNRTWPVLAWEPGAIIEGDAYVPIPLDLPPGAYSLVISLSDAGNRQLGLVLPDGSFGGTHLTLGHVQVTDPPYRLDTLDLPQTLDVPLTGLYLIAAAPPPAEHWAGATLPFSLGWERTPGDPPDELSWELLCESGQHDGGLLTLAPSAPATWRPGHRYVTHYAPRTSTELASDTCRLRVQVGQSTTEPGPAQAILGTVMVHARERTFTLPQAPQRPLSVTVGTFAHLVGADVATGTLHPGDGLPLTLYWAAQGPADRDYTVFVHLVGPDGQAWGQSDAWPESGNAPTTSWLPGQIIIDAHAPVLREDAPAGEYTLFVGLYEPDSGVRVSLYNANGAQIPDDRAPVIRLNIMP